MANWNDLPYEIKMIIIKKMKFTTRNKLKMCSRLDRVMVNSVPLKFGEVWIMTFDDEMKMSVCDTSKSILFEIKKCEPNTLKVVFHKTRRYISYSGIEEARQIFNKYAHSFLATIFHARNVEIGDFYTRMPFPIEFTNAINKPRCDVFGLRLSSSMNVKDWLDHFTMIRFTFNEETSPDLVVNDPDALAMLMNCDWLDMEVPNCLTDDHLMNFNGKVIWMGPSNITSTGINRFIKKLIADDEQYSKMISFHFEMKGGKLWWNEVIQDIRCRQYDDYGICFEHESANGKKLYLSSIIFDSDVIISKKKQ